MSLTKKKEKKFNNVGTRSLSGDGRGRSGRPLFGSDDLDDSPLQMSSIDGVSAQAGAPKGKETQTDLRIWVCIHKTC